MVDEKVQLLVLCLDSIGQLVEDQKMTCSVLGTVSLCLSPHETVSLHPILPVKNHHRQNGSL